MRRLRAAETFLRVLMRALLLGACLAAASAPARAVVGGELDPNDAGSPFGGVASVSASNGAIFSAVLVSPRHAVSAAHVFAAVDPSAWTLNLNAGGDLSSQHAISAVHVAPGYLTFSTGVGGVPLVHADIVVLELATPAPASVPYYEIAPLNLNDAITLVGYGMSGPLGGPFASMSTTAKYKGANVADLSLSVPQPPESFFDIFAYTLGPGKAHILDGDSGGPAFVNVNGTWKLAGINTFLWPFPTPTLGGGIVLSVHQDWIAEVTAIPEPGTWALLVAGLAALGLVARRRSRR